MSCWLNLAREVCLAHGWHVWHATAGSAESVWVAGHVSRVSSPWNSHHSERMFSIPQPRTPLLLWEKVKFGPSVTDQRAGPSSWWPSTAVKMFSRPSPIACLTYSHCGYFLWSLNVIIEINLKKVVPPKLKSCLGKRTSLNYRYIMINFKRTQYKTTLTPRFHVDTYK